MTDINTPTGWDERLNSIMEQINELSEKEQSELLVMLQQNKKNNNWKESLRWNKKAILNDLRENHVKIDENANYMWYKWKKVHFSLPAVWNFEWFKLDYFVSNDIVYRRHFESNPELEKKSKSMKQIWEILKAMNRYMAELWVETDWDMDYENDLQFWRDGGKRRCDAWDCLEEVTGLDRWYWTSDKAVDGREDSRVKWGCYRGICLFARRYDYGYDYNYYAHLFLGLSD